MSSNRHTEIIRRDAGTPADRPLQIETIIAPMADLFEVPDAFIMKLDMPGALKESIQLNIEPDRLTVTAVTGSQHPETAAVLFSEIGRKKYQREFNLGAGIDHDKTQAQFEYGVLTVTLPKNENYKPRDIQIH